MITVLIVEDNPSIAKLLRRRVETLRFSTLLVSNIRDALTMLDEADILVLDLKLNGDTVDSNLVLETWTSKRKGPACVVGEGIDDDTVYQLMQEGATVVLQKSDKFLDIFNTVIVQLSKWAAAVKSEEEMQREVTLLRQQISETRDEMEKKNKRRTCFTYILCSLALILGGIDHIPAILKLLP